MSARMLLRVVSHIPPRPLSRTLSTHIPRRSPHHDAHTRRLSSIGLASGILTATTLVVISSQSPVHADSQANSAPSPPLTSLVRSYVVYAMCSIPSLVDWSPTILSTCLSIPVVRTITEAFVRVTFFDQVSLGDNSGMQAGAFLQFVGAETAEDALPLLERYRAENKGCLFAYSVEVDEAEAAGKKNQKDKNTPPAHKQIVKEMIHSIDVAADFEDTHRSSSGGTGRSTWVAVKLTALVPDHHLMIRLSRYLVECNQPESTTVVFPGTPSPTDLGLLRHSASASNDLVSLEDIALLKELRADLDRICHHAQERGVKIIIDAEHSWYQPAIDAFALYLMEKYNRPSGRLSNVQPLVYNTYQAYLRRNPAHLAHSLRAAKDRGFSLGVKLVRGAYHSHEMEAHASQVSISPDTLPPVWSTKPETDKCYNACVEVLLDAIAEDVRHALRRSSSGFLSLLWPSPSVSAPSIGVLFGTHNWTSCKLILDGLVSRGLARQEGTTSDGESVLRVGDEVTERLTLAQLYGMHDNLTDYLVGRLRTTSPCVIKYVPYGSLKEVMPYLSRRAIENKSVLGEGAAAAERLRAWAGIKSKILGL